MTLELLLILLLLALVLGGKSDRNRGTIVFDPKPTKPRPRNNLAVVPLPGGPRPAPPLPGEDE